MTDVDGAGTILSLIRKMKGGLVPVTDKTAMEPLSAPMQAGGEKINSAIIGGSGMMLRSSITILSHPLAATSVSAYIPVRPYSTPCKVYGNPPQTAAVITNG